MHEGDHHLPAAYVATVEPPQTVLEDHESKAKYLLRRMLLHIE